ncbi:MAG: cupin domain-containing protein, partial [Myxococcaceae bacterium]|nr:cupin domain-containing protein [Myxococcaceae bacterium]
MSRAPSWKTRDPLGEALHFLRLSGTFYSRSELTAPWGMTMPGFEGCLWFHAIVSGGCLLEGRGLPATSLAKGDFVLVPHGRGHVLKSQARVAVPDVTELPQQQIGEHYSLLSHGGGGAPTSLVCGVVRFDHPSARDLTDLLPAVVRVQPSDAMDSTLRLMASEARALQPGGETVLTRLADVLVIQALRAWLANDDPGRTGWLGALRDPQLGLALAAVHREPERGWSVRSLARVAAMSRSA